MHEMTVIVETTSVRQLDRLLEIEQTCFKEEAFTRRQIASLLTDYNSLCLVAEEDDQIIGFIIGTPYFERDSLTGHILTIDVEPQNRRKGVGARLLQEMERIFKEKGVKACRLEVREDNTAALGLYKKLGYIGIARLKGYYGRTDGIYLRKALV
jgi:ribosomal-protein-alanine N-acetyltransferase